MKKKINFKKRPIICLTSYNKFFAEIADQFCDIVLVGDSLGMAYYGDTSTRSVSLNDMIRHAKSVRSGVKKALMVVDMPYGTCKNPLLAKKQGYRSTFRQLKKWGLDFHELKLGKTSYDLIIDDKALGFRKNWYSNFKKKLKKIN